MKERTFGVKLRKRHLPGDSGLTSALKLNCEQPANVNFFIVAHPLDSGEHKVIEIAYLLIKPNRK